MTTFACGAATDLGRVRRTNQDQFLITDPVFVVADGMGGHNGGEIASAIAVETLAKADHVTTIDELIEWVQQANTEIVTRARLDVELRGMGTTVCVLVGLSAAGQHRLGIANVGDSRLYRRTDKGLHQHTEDHSLVEALVRDGRLTRAEAVNHPQRNIVTRALGIDEKVLVDAWELVPVEGDRYLLCTDGLFGEVETTEIQEVVRDVESPQAAADELVSRACEAGGRDNVTAVVVDVLEADSVDDPPTDRVSSTRKALPDGIFAPDTPADADDSDASADPHPDETVVAGPATVFTWRLVAFITAVVIVLAVLLTSITVYARSNYFVEVEADTVVVYQGRPGGVLWFDPTIEGRISFDSSQLDALELAALTDGLEFDSLDEAEAFAHDLLEQADPASS